jgi:hypothetical protein
MKFVRLFLCCLKEFLRKKKDHYSSSYSNFFKKEIEGCNDRNKIPSSLLTMKMRRNIHLTKRAKRRGPNHIRGLRRK